SRDLFDCRGYAIIILFETDQFRPETNIDVRETLESFKYGAVNEWLEEAKFAWPPERLSLWVVGHDDVALAVDKPHDVVPNGKRDDFINEIHSLHGAERFIVDSYAAWIVDEIRTSLEQNDVNPIDSEQICQHQACRASARDNNVGIEGI